jgi:hypothetical protein
MAGGFASTTDSRTSSLSRGFHWTTTSVSPTTDTIRARGIVFRIPMASPRVRVAQVVEAHLADTAGTQRGLVALEQLGAVDGLARVRMGEHQVIVATPQRLLMQQVELAGEPVGERHAA